MSLEQQKQTSQIPQTREKNILEENNDIIETIGISDVELNAIYQNYRAIYQTFIINKCTFLDLIGEGSIEDKIFGENNSGEYYLDIFSKKTEKNDKYRYCEIYELKQALSNWQENSNSTFNLDLFYDVVEEINDLFQQIAVILLNPDQYNFKDNKNKKEDVIELCKKILKFVREYYIHVQDYISYKNLLAAGALKYRIRDRNKCKNKKEERKKITQFLEKKLIYTYLQNQNK
jgi:hypothetical protein